MKLELIKVLMKDLGKAGRSELTEFALTGIYIDLTNLKLIVQINTSRWIEQAE